MTQSHSDIVAERFGAAANAYVDSAVHARGADLDALEALVERLKPARAPDLGCGGGHVAYLMARHAAAAQAMPFADGAFDFLACRFSAHHWSDFEGGLRDARRVLTMNTRRLRMEFGSWIARTRTSLLHAQAIKSLQAAAA